MLLSKWKIGLHFKVWQTPVNKLTLIFILVFAYYFIFQREISKKQQTTKISVLRKRETASLQPTISDKCPIVDLGTHRKHTGRIGKRSAFVVRGRRFIRRRSRKQVPKKRQAGNKQTKQQLPTPSVEIRRRDLEVSEINSWSNSWDKGSLPCFW